MYLTRRSFLKSGAITALSAGLILQTGALALGQKSSQSTSAEGFQIPYEATQSPTFYYTRETFQPYVGGIFVARGVGGRAVELKLLRVRDCTPSSKTRLTTEQAPKTDCFALEFSSPARLSELTSIYKLNHAALGEFELFMTSREDEREQIFYEAVFNHLIP
jgi:hypothetical protein